MNNIQRAKTFHTIALTGYFGLFILLMLWNTVLSTHDRFTVAPMLIISIIPLLLPLRGLLHGRLKTCAWAAYISLLYLIHGSIEAFVNVDNRFYALLETLFSLMLFFGATYYVRFAAKSANDN